MRNQGEPGAAGRNQEQPGGEWRVRKARRSQEQPGGQDEPGAARSSQEELGESGVPGGQEDPGEPTSSQEKLGRARSYARYRRTAKLAQVVFYFAFFCLAGLPHC